MQDKTYQHWTIDEDKTLVALYADQSTALLAKHFNRPVRAIHNRVRKLGLRKSHSFVRELNRQICYSRHKHASTTISAGA